MYTTLILAALVVTYLLDVTTSLLNLRASRQPLPEDLSDIYEPEEYHRSQSYTRAATRFHLVHAAFDLVTLLIFWFAGGFAWLDLVVRGFGFSPIGSGLLYIGALVVATGLLSLPFSIYSTFRLEARFGFNRTTPRTFVLDLLKGVLLGLVLGTPLLAAILWFFGEAGPYAWVYAWIAVTLFTLTIQYVAPRYLMPLFNRFEPLAEGELRQAILDYAHRVGFPVGEIYVMDGSKRSERSNAFFTGFGRNRRIVLFDTLIVRHSVSELVGILAHEVGHYKKKHIPRGMALGILQMGVMFFLLSVFLKEEALFRAFFVEQVSVYAGLVFFGLLFSPVETLLSIPIMMLSRLHEYQADRYAAVTTGNARPLMDALKKLSGHNLSNLTPHPSYVFWHYSHPPLRERLAALEKVEMPR